jgi:hypothetical protein
MAVMASFTPVDVVRLAAVSRLRVLDEDLQPVADIHLASAEPMLRADLPDVNLAPVVHIGFITKAKKPSINDYLDVAGPEESPRRHSRGLRGPLAFPGGAL